MADKRVLVGVAVVAVLALAVYAYRAGFFGSKKEGMETPTLREAVMLNNDLLAGQMRANRGDRHPMTWEGGVKSLINSGFITPRQLQQKHVREVISRGFTDKSGFTEGAAGGCGSGGGGKLRAGYPNSGHQSGEPVRPEERYAAEQAAWQRQRGGEVDHFDPFAGATAAVDATEADLGYNEYLQDLVVPPDLQMRHLSFVQSAKPVTAGVLIVDSLEMANYINRVGLKSFNVQGVDQVNPQQLTEIDSDDTAVNPTEVRIL
jgi:hypothetical protein